MNVRLFATAIIAMILFDCQQANDKAQSNNPFLDYELLSKIIVERSQLQPSEKVLLVARPGRFDPIVPLLKAKIEDAGAIYLGTISVAGQPGDESWNTEFTNGAEDKNVGSLTEYFDSVDLGIMLPGASTADAAYAAMQNVLKNEKGRTIHFHWEGAYDLAGAPLTVDSSIDRFYQQVLKETDYQSLSFAQQQFDSAMRNKWITVTTPAGTNLKFMIADRPVTKQDGDASKARTARGKNLIDREIELPPGAIRVAPVEETVEGTIAFPDGVWGGEAVTGLKMIFKNGRVEQISTDSRLDAVYRELDEAGVAGKSFREFALGFNPLLAIPTEGEPWIPYYGYGAGVVRLSLGDNTELSGKVSGPYVRWNFFTDATVMVGDEVWVRDGRLVEP